MANKTAYKFLAGGNISCHVQVLDRGIAHPNEGGNIISLMVIHVEGQRMAVTVEGTTISDIRIKTHHSGACVKIGIEAGVHVVLTLGSLYLIAERLPVVSIVDGEEEWRNILYKVEGRLVALHIHIYIIMYARAREIQHLVALLALVLVQLDGSVLNDLAVVVRCGEVQHHLGTVVPHTIVFISIVPRHANGVGTLVFPLGTPVGNAQQV